MSVSLCLQEWAKTCSVRFRSICTIAKRCMRDESRSLPSFPHHENHDAQIVMANVLESSLTHWVMFILQTGVFFVPKSSARKVCRRRLRNPWTPTTPPPPLFRIHLGAHRCKHNKMSLTANKKVQDKIMGGVWASLHG